MKTVPTPQTLVIEGQGGQSRSWWRAMGRGFAKKCPQCTEGGLFKSYLKTRDACPSCGLDLSDHRADDAPPYLTMMAVGHVMVPLALAHKQFFDPPLWLQFAFWMPAMIIATFWLLPRMKGAMVGLQWANRMHGFAGDGADPDAFCDESV